MKSVCYDQIYHHASIVKISGISQESCNIVESCRNCSFSASHNSQAQTKSIPKEFYITSQFGATYFCFKVNMHMYQL